VDVSDFLLYLERIAADEGVSVAFAQSVLDVCSVGYCKVRNARIFQGRAVSKASPVLGLSAV